MYQISTFMGPGEGQLTQHSALPLFNSNVDKLRWRKYIRCWAATVHALADGGDGRAKGMLIAIGIPLYWSVSRSRLQLLEISIEIREFVLNPSNPECTEKAMVIMNQIINIIAKNSASDSIKRFATLIKTTTTCLPSRAELMPVYIESFFVLEQSYLNLTSSDRSSTRARTSR